MRGDLMLMILETVVRATAETVVGVMDVFDVLVSSGYGASHSKFSRALREIDHRRTHDALMVQVGARERQRYHAMIYKLKRDGLLIEKKDRHGKLFILTVLGREKLSALREKKKIQLPTPSYSVLKSDNFTIVAFDVPEKERRKRNWLREVLLNLGLKMIQKSVWIGKVKIPEECIDDMKSIHILEFVEIFEISKTGSLHHVA
jgi:DNA-binding transcriptional regulator PaaX